MNGWRLYQHRDTGDLVWARPMEGCLKMVLDYEACYVRIDQHVFDKYYEKVKGVE
jgi:hypothetical protein